MPISVLPWASASRRLSFTRPSPPLPVHRMQARIHTPGVVRVPTVGTVVREKYYYPGKSGRVPSRWRIGHVRTEPAIDGRKETFSVRHPLLPPPFVTSAFEGCAPTRSKKGETWPCFGRPYINRGGKGKKAVDGDRYSSSSSKLGQSERPDLNIF